MLGIGFCVLSYMRKMSESFMATATSSEACIDDSSENNEATSPLVENTESANTPAERLDTWKTWYHNPHNCAYTYAYRRLSPINIIYYNKLRRQGNISSAFSLSQIFLIINMDFPLRTAAFCHAVCTAWAGVYILISTLFCFAIWITSASRRLFR